MGKAGEMKNKTTSIRNLIPRRAYKERGQLEDRKHLGIILEKHKDYKRRSQNFKQKDKVISKSVF
jgi:lactam utilization protein B